MIPWWRVDLGEREAAAAANAVRGRCLSQGTIAQALEERIAALLKVPYAVTATSGTAALTMAYAAVGIAEGDEVIVPNRTFIATAHAARVLGARIVLCETEPDRPILDVAKLREKITPRTKLIVPVHLNGRSVRMEELLAIAAEYRIPVVEDACQALFSQHHGAYLGTLADIGCFSLGVTKLFTSGQGGIAVTRDKQLYERMKLFKNHGVVDTLNGDYRSLGFNFKYTDIQAAVALEQLDQVEQKRRRVLELQDLYRQGLTGLSSVQLLPVHTDQGELPIYVEVLCAERGRVMQHLAAQGIQSRAFLPDLARSVHLKQPVQFSTTQFDTRGLFLPAGPDLPHGDAEEVLRALHRL